MLILIFLLLFCGTSYADLETYAVEDSNGIITILNYDPAGPKTLEQVLEDSGIQATSILRVTAKDLPATKSDRNFWKKQSKKIVVDTDKKKDHEDAKKVKEQERDAVLSKIGISKEELEKLK